MKAAVYSRYGPPEVVSVQEVHIPVPKDQEVLVEVYAATVNRTDCGFRSAVYFISRVFSGLFVPRNKILGNEFAGIVVAKGAEVDLYSIGDRVFGYDDALFGAHATYKTMDQHGAMALIPERLTFKEAAPLTEGIHYAWCDLQAAKVKAGQQIMVYGATGSIGSAAVQLAKYLGATVTAACYAKDFDLVRSLGADEVFDCTKNELFAAGSFDLIFDAVGKLSFGKCRHLLREQGIYISTELGKRSENVFLALTTPLFNQKKVMFPIPKISKADVILFGTLAESGKLRAVIDREYPLANIVEAYRYVEMGQKVGNVLLNLREGARALE